MAKVNVNDRTSLERVYPADAFINDAARNESTDAIRHGVRIGSAPDDTGTFDLERAALYAGEMAPPHFLAPGQASGMPPDRGYAQFLEDIVETAHRVGFVAAESPGLGEPRLRGFHGG